MTRLAGLILFAALSAAAPSALAQDNSGTAAGQQSVDAPAGTRDPVPTKPRREDIGRAILFEAVRALTRPKPPPPAEPLPQPPVEVSPPPPARPVAVDPVAAAPAPVVPASAVALVRPPPAPRQKPLASQPRPAIAPAPVRPAAIAPPTPPLIVEAPPSLPVEPPAAVLPGPPPVDIAAPSPAPAPTVVADRAPGILSASRISAWPLLALIALAVAIAAAALQVRRARRLARTRAALSLYPRIDWSAGAGSARGLALACPPLTIAGRLDLGDARFG